MAEIKVDAKKNVYVVPGGWKNMFDKASKLTLSPGTYDIRIKSGLFSFWNSGPQEEPMVFLLINGSFRNSKTGIPTTQTWMTLNGLADQFVLEVTGNTTIYALFIDINPEDNRGVVTLSCSMVA